MKKLLLLFLIIPGILLCLPTDAAISGKNIIKNSGFENGRKHWEKKFGQVGVRHFKYDEKKHFIFIQPTKKRGKRVMEQSCYDNDGECGSENFYPTYFSGIRQKIVIPERFAYLKFSFKYKLKSEEKYKQSNDDHCAIALVDKTNQNNTLLHKMLTSRNSPSKKWKFVTKKFNDQYLAGNKVNVIVVCGNYSPYRKKPKLLIDKITFKAIEP
ncbi:hypothetical protein KKC88_01370 [Patescibacteria group bacterium]|nr:hypothetical protein [Patescibacteria group bacterium]MBU1673477.1 hypothetical protein [Patescibacteria group bacterium]MBU1963992.1 hypothetical protein [Patescibacteria group bacterium]